MYKGKYSNNNKRRLTSWAALALALVLTLSVGGTVAYLITKTDAVKNTFTPGRVSCEVNESFNNNVKTNVSIQNTGNVKAYIRATVVVNWVTETGKVCANHTHTVEIVPKGSAWKENSGYYYYTKPVDPDDFTDKLISNEIKLSQADDGCKMQVTILAQAIQAEGVDSSNKKAVVDAWGVDPAELG